MTERSQSTFQYLGTSFQVSVLSLCIFDNEFLTNYSSLLKKEYFSSERLSYLYERVAKYFKKQRRAPQDLLTTELKIEVEQKGLSETEYRLLRTLIWRSRKTYKTLDRAYVISKVCEFAKSKAYEVAVKESIALIREGKLSEIEERMRKASIVGTSQDLGLNLFEDPHSRILDRLNNPPPRIATLLRPIDSALKGGSLRGKMGIIVAPPGYGKTTFLTHIAKTAVFQKKKVIIYTGEESSDDIAFRLERAIAGISSDDYSRRVRKVLESMKSCGQMFSDSLLIKEFIEGRATVDYLREHIHLARTSGFYPDLVVVDYADLLKSSSHYGDVWVEQGMVYQELRGFAKENKVALWTGCHQDKQSLQKTTPDLNDARGSFDKIGIADYVMFLTLPNKRGNNRLVLKKTRGGISNIEVQVRIDFARNRITSLIED